jgi:hypothetical protein
MVIEWASESYLFTCKLCGEQWREVYQVRNVTDLDGDVWSFYRHDDQPCETPTAAENLCPRCHCGPVRVSRVSRSVPAWR